MSQTNPMIQTIAKEIGLPHDFNKYGVLRVLHPFGVIELTRASFELSCENIMLSLTGIIQHTDCKYEAEFNYDVKPTFYDNSVSLQVQEAQNWTLDLWHGVEYGLYRHLPDDLLRQAGVIVWNNARVQRERKERDDAA